jgi:hypothetical protein
MKRCRLIYAPRVLPLLALAGCVLAAPAGARSVAHAAPARSPYSVYCLKHHYASGATAVQSVLRVNGLCFPIPSSAHIAMRNLTTGAVLRTWTTIPVVTSLPAVQWTGQFHYVTQGDAAPGTTIRVWIVDGAWHRTFTILDQT